MSAERLRPIGARERGLLLDEILNAAIGPTLLRRYWAHRAAHAVHRSIHIHFPPERVDHDLRRAEDHLI